MPHIPVAYWREEIARLNEQAKSAPPEAIVKALHGEKIDKPVEGRIEVGAAVQSAYFHRDLGIWGFFERKRTARGFSYDPCRILEHGMEPDCKPRLQGLRVRPEGPTTASAASRLTTCTAPRLPGG